MSVFPRLPFRLPFRRAELFWPGLLLGFEGYAVFHLMPSLLAALGHHDTIDLMVGAALVLLVLSQMELGKRLSMIPPGIALRDMIFGQSAAFVFFILAPEFLWLSGSLIAWIVFSSGLAIAAGRWSLLKTDHQDGIGDNVGFLAGLIVGLIGARLFPFQGWSAELLGIVGILLAIIGSLRIHFFARPLEGYSSGGALWFWRDLRRNPTTLAMMTRSAAAGLMLGFLGFSGVQIGAVIFGLIMAAALLVGLARRFAGEKESLAGHLLAGAALIIDAVFWQALTLSPFVLAAAAAVTVVGARTGAWPPRLMITAAECMGLQQLSLALGLVLAGLIHLRGESPLYTLGGLGALLIGAAVADGIMGGERGRSYPATE